MYNGCTASDFGITWTDTGGKTPISVVIELNRGISCESGSSRSAPTTLNSVSSGSYTWTDSGSQCACDPSTAELTWTLTDLTGFNAGGKNTFLIDGKNCEGLTQNGSRNGAYARLTVNY